MVTIRAFRPDHLDDLYRICLETATGGGATAGRDPKLVGHVYAGPYAVLSPRSVFVVEDGHGVGGYVLGAPDMRRFEARLEAEWWPGLREIYTDPSERPRAEWSFDQLMIGFVGRNMRHRIKPWETPIQNKRMWRPATTRV